MRFYITGECGFIARNLKIVLEQRGHEVASSDDELMIKIGQENCVYRNSSLAWSKFFDMKNVDVVIHNAAVVGTDVVALQPSEATLTNVQGTKNIVDACSTLGIPVCFLGTSVIYRTECYQDVEIDETSEVLPKTYYGVLKHAGDQIISTAKIDASIVRPLFAYGGVGDMNSLIAKTLFASWKKRNNLSIFLDPNKIKDYIHVLDFCDAVAIVCEQKIWNEDLIVSAQDPRPISAVVECLREYCDPAWPLEKFLTWLPETDYLGNHRLSSAKFRKLTNWTPKQTLEQGIASAAQDIQREMSSINSDYDPLKYLDKAALLGLDLKQNF